MLGAISSLQQSLDILSDRSGRNDMWITPPPKKKKTKEIIVCFCKDKDHHVNMPKLAINETIIERVSHAKVLGVTLSANLCWNMHVENILYVRQVNGCICYIPS